MKVPRSFCRPAYVATGAVTEWLRRVNEEASKSSRATGAPIPMLRPTGFAKLTVP